MQVQERDRWRSLTTVACLFFDGSCAAAGNQILQYFGREGCATRIQAGKYVNTYLQNRASNGVQLPSCSKPHTDQAGHPTAHGALQGNGTHEAADVRELIYLDKLSITTTAAACIVIAVLPQRNANCGSHHCWRVVKTTGSGVPLVDDPTHSKPSVSDAIWSIASMCLKRSGKTCCLKPPCITARVLISRIRVHKKFSEVRTKIFMLKTTNRKRQPFLATHENLLSYQNPRQTPTVDPLHS